MKRILLVMSLSVMQQVQSVEFLNKILESEQTKKMFEQIVTAGVIFVSAKLGWKEFGKGNLIPGQQSKEKSSEVVKKELYDECARLDRDLSLNRKLLLYLFSVCNEVERANFEALLSDEEKLIFAQVA